MLRNGYIGTPDSWGNPFGLRLFFSSVQEKGWGLLACTLALWMPVLFGQPLPADQLRFFHIGVEDGLSQGSVRSMLKDSRGFMWFGTLEGLNRYDGHHFRNFHTDVGAGDNTLLRGVQVFGIIEDGRGDLWVGTEECLNRYRRQDDLFDYYFSAGPDSSRVSGITYPIAADEQRVWYLNDREGLCELDLTTGHRRILLDSILFSTDYYSRGYALRDAHGRFWIQRSKGIYCFDPARNRLESFFSDHPENLAGAASKILCSFLDSRGALWLSTEQAFLRLDTAARQYDTIRFEGGPGSPVISMADDGDGTLWLGTVKDGIYLYQVDGNRMRNLRYRQHCQECLHNNEISHIYIDPEGAVWVNTDPQGIDRITRQPRDFLTIETGDELPPFFTRRPIRAVEEDRLGRIWLGTQHDGILLYHPADGSVEQLSQLVDRHGMSGRIRTLFCDRTGIMWIGTDKGIGRFDVKTGEFRRQVIRQAGPQASRANFVHAFAQLSDTLLLIATESGLYSVHQRSMQVKEIPALKGKHLQALSVDHRGRVWVGVFQNGYRVLEAQPDGAWRQLESGLPEFNINCMLEDSLRATRWLGTNKGLCVRSEGEEWQCMNVQGGLPSAYIYGGLMDREGHLWVSTNKGISKWDRKKGRFYNFDPNDGLQGYEFNTRSCLAASDGTFYFGGVDGVNFFTPATIDEEGYSDFPVYLSALQVNDRVFREGGYVGEADTIHLGHDENTIALEFGALDYNSGGHNHYRYILEGYDDGWTEAYHLNYARYTKLPPGAYSLQVMAANSRMVWSPQKRTLHFLIATPWWKRGWAWSLYAAAAAAFVFVAFRSWSQRRRARQEANYLRQVDEIKNRFFTNITHEFRTPLTMIMLPVARAIREARQLDDQELRIIQQQGKKLQYFIDQLMKMRSMHEQGVLPQLINGDVIEYLGYLADSFQGYALEKNIDFSFEPAYDYLFMDYDQEKLSFIVSNLLVNAFKFTPTGGQVRLEIGRYENELIVHVHDTGLGIATEHQARIFDEFYQVEPERPEGAGIGLALVRQMTTLLDGTVSLNSEPGQGSVFTVRLPIRQEAPSQESMGPPSAAEPAPFVTPASGEVAGNQRRILLIEDNPLVRRVIGQELQKEYHLEYAGDGEEGLDKALTDRPDLVICDVLLPKMNGYAVCRKLKSDERTSHIPLIILTALSDGDSRIRGLECGAEAFLAKPFDDRELRVRIEQLLKLSDRLRAISSGKLIDRGLAAEAPAEEAAFVQHFRRLVEAELTDPDFSVPALCRSMGLSHTQLHRKLKALTGLSAIQLIRQIRLDKAKELLAETQLNISEIAYETGFNDPSYFGRVFAKETGHPPSAYREVKKEESIE